MQWLIFSYTLKYFNNSNDLNDNMKKEGDELKMNKKQMQTLELLKSYENLLGRNDPSFTMKMNYQISQYSRE